MPATRQNTTERHTPNQDQLRLSGIGSSADGTTGCSGSPKVCTPLWTVTSTGGSFWDTPEIVNGMLFVTNKNGIPLSGYKLP